MPSKSRYKEWEEPENITKIINWAANGCLNKELAHNMGIHRDTLNEWCKVSTAISDAIKKGRELSVQAIENQFFKNAFGTLEEVTEIIEQDQDWDNERKEWVTVKRHVRRTTRKIPPSTAAQIFYLKNKAGYSDNPEVKESELDKVNEIIVKIKELANG